MYNRETSLTKIKGGHYYVKCRKIVAGIESYAKEEFDEEILNHFSNAPEGLPSVTSLVNEDIEKFIKDASLDELFDVEDKETQRKLLRKIMYFTYIQGLGNDAESFMFKGMLKILGKM